MENIIQAFITIIIIAIMIYVFIRILNEGAKQEVKEEMQEQRFQEIQQQSINMNTQNNTMTEEEYREKSLQQMQSTNINLVQLQSQIAKQNKKIEEIEKNVGCITTIMLLPIALGIIGFLISALAGYNILQNIL